MISGLWVEWVMCALMYKAEMTLKLYMTLVSDSYWSNMIITVKVLRHKNSTINKTAHQYF